MPRRPLLPFVLLLAPLLPSLLSAAEKETAPAGPPIVERSYGALEIDGQRIPIGYSISTVGPLVTLHPIVARLGGDLEIGLLRQSHQLALGDRTFIFGPGSGAVTVNDRIVDLSQPPVTAEDGLRVPIDLLRDIYTELLGYDFEWRGAEGILVASRRPLREIAVDVDVVHLQGVTTVVLEFPVRPRYRIAQEHERVRVSVLGDELSLASRRQPNDPLLRDLRVSAQEVELLLAPGASARDYTLEDPFRLVFDIYRGSQPAAGGGAIAGERGLRPPPRDAGLYTIVVDPGHGGTDTGAVGPGGTAEKDLSLLLARALQSQLQSRLPVRVILTRDEDAELPLSTRAALANQSDADLFVSLHLNSAYRPSAHGAETYFLSLEASDERAAEAAAAHNPVTPDPQSDLQLILWDMAQNRHLAESQRLANLIQEELNQAMRLRDRGVKQAPFAVLMGANMPAVLVEVGFLSNPAEEERLLDPSYRAALVEALVRAVTRFRAQSSAPVATVSEGFE